MRPLALVITLAFTGDPHTCRSNAVAAIIRLLIRSLPGALAAAPTSPSSAPAAEGDLFCLCTKLYFYGES